MQALDELRVRAEEMVSDSKGTRRPSWAPRILLDGIQRQLDEARSSSVVSMLTDALHTTEAKSGGWSFSPRYISGTREHPVEIWNRIVELGKVRLLEFAGATDVQMQEAGRYCGHCCVCGKALSDPISIECGIGPECRHRFQVSTSGGPGAWIIGGRDAEVA
jgi:Family of unknown function (DUF6011)